MNCGDEESRGDATGFLGVVVRPLTPDRQQARARTDRARRPEMPRNRTVASGSPASSAGAAGNSTSVTRNALRARAFWIVQPVVARAAGSAVGVAVESKIMAKVRTRAHAR